MVERVSHRAAEREREHECGQQRHVVGELGQDDRERQGHPGHASEHCRGTDDGKGAPLPSLNQIIVKGELPHQATQQTANGHSGHEVTCGEAHSEHGDGEHEVDGEQRGAFGRRRLGGSVPCRAHVEVLEHTLLS
eukprot:scaffold46025_cov55-Phaeocystis_antarctica.AAC.1